MCLVVQRRISAGQEETWVAMEGTGKIRPLFGLNVSSLGEVYVSEGPIVGLLGSFRT